MARIIRSPLLLAAIGLLLIGAMAHQSFAQSAHQCTATHHAEQDDCADGQCVCACHSHALAAVETHSWECGGLPAAGSLMERSAGFAEAPRARIEHPPQLA